jgi:hypothetical protein
MEQLINEVYAVFSKYEKPYGFAACECCLSPEEKTALLATPLRELTADQLGGYAADVFFTMGEVSDFKYFLPRILELSVNDQFLWPDPEVVTRKLSLAQWCDWPTEEQTIITDLLKTKFATLVDDPNTDGSETDKWVCALGRCFPNPTPFLAPLLEPRHVDRLLAFIEYNGSLFTKNKLDNPFWKDARDSEQLVVRWLHQPAIKALFSDRYGMVF